MAMVFTDATKPDYSIIFANHSFLGLTGYDREEARQPVETTGT